METIEILKKAALAADAKQASDILALDVHEQTTLADYFLICSAGSVNQVRACTEEIERKLKEEGVRCLASEGQQAGNWVLLDFGGVLVHIFRREMREFYGIERLWNESPKLDWKA